MAGVCLAASAVIGTEYPEYLVEETADDINEQVLVANESGVWRYDVSSTNWTARGKFADALGAKSVVQAGTTVYIATWLNGVGKILTCGQRGGALGEFATLSFQPTKLAVSRDGASLWVSGFGANGGVWRYPLADASAAARVVSSCQADGVLDAHKDRVAVIATHAYLGPVTYDKLRYPHCARDVIGRMAWKKCHGKRGNTPEEMWRKCFSRHGNLCLVVCGDQSCAITWRQTSKNAAGGTVNEVLQDFGAGSESDWVRLFRFHPDKRRIDVVTVSAADGRTCLALPDVPDAAEHRFTLTY